MTKKSMSRDTPAGDVTRRVGPDDEDICPECGAAWDFVACGICGFDDRVCSGGCGFETMLEARQEIRRLKAAAAGWSSTPPKPGQSFVVRGKSGERYFQWLAGWWMQQRASPEAPDMLYAADDILGAFEPGDRVFIIRDDPEDL